MKTVSDIMVSNVVSVKTTDSIHHARSLLKEMNIRHLPVTDSATGDFVGVLSQRVLLNHAFKTVEKYGLSYLEKRDKQTSVSEVMVEGGIELPQIWIYFPQESFLPQKNPAVYLLLRVRA